MTLFARFFVHTVSYSLQIYFDFIWINWSQKNSLLLQDYHVFLILKDPKETKVYDFDTVLEFPVTFNNYVKQAIKPEYNEHYERFGLFKSTIYWLSLKKKSVRNIESIYLFSRLFRVISADIFLSTFASDRSHMRKPDGSYTSDPPFYAPISSKGKLFIK